MIRPGHHRPLGTTTTMRFVGWHRERLPELGDLAAQISSEGSDDAHVLRRLYRVVGFEEGRSLSSFRLVMERVAWHTLGDPSVSDEQFWSFYNVPRSPR